MRNAGWREEGLEVMRYQTRFPLETGKRVAVFDLQDNLFPEERKVLTLLPAAGKPEDFRGLVKQVEARISLQHPALPPVRDIAFRGKSPGLVSDFIDSPMLENMAGTIDFKNARHIALVLCDLLHQLHKRNLFLGYINPRKIFIRQNRNPILNFLLTEISTSPARLSDYSARYAAPEFLKTGDPSPASDCYSLGMILYILFTGTCPVLLKPPLDKKLLQGKTVLPSAC